MKLFCSQSLWPLLLIACLLAGACRGQEQPGGLEFGLSQAGLTTVTDVTVEVLQQGLTNLQLPDQTDKALTPIGYVTINVTQLYITTVEIQGFSVNIVPGTGFSLVMNPCVIDLTFDWNWRQDLWPHASEDGTGTGGSNAKITATTTLGVSNGRPSADVSALNIDLSDFEFHLKGSIVTWFLDIFIDIFKPIIKDIVQHELNKQVPAILNQELNAALSTFPTSLAIFDILEFYYPFQSFTASSSILSWSMEGLASAVGQPQNLSPFSMPSMPVSLSPLTMAEIFISDFMFNTALYTLYTEGLLNFAVSQSQLPPSMQYLLNTNEWKLAVPALYRAFPNSPMQLVFSPDASPFVNFSASEAASATLPGFMTVNIVGNGTAFVLQGTVNLDLNISVSSGTNTIHVAVESVSVVFDLYSSNIGSFSTIELRSIINTVLAVGIPIVNKMLSPGLTIPTIKGLSLINPQLIWNDGFFMIGSNITYT